MELVASRRTHTYRADLCPEAREWVALRSLLTRQLAEYRHHPGYKQDLILEAMLALYDQTKESALLDYVQRVMNFRGEDPSAFLNWRLMFTGLHYELWQRTGDERLVAGWVREAVSFDDSLPRDKKGRILFPHKGEQQRLLIDMLQGYAVTMARAGCLSGDSHYFQQAVDQYNLYAACLRDPATGLWHHARGWVDGVPGHLSPQGWCRGQAWVLRGLVQVLSLLPNGHPGRTDLLGHLYVLVDALLEAPRPTGLWHQMVQEPDRAYPETSGSGMMCYYLWQASVKEFINHDKVDSTIFEVFTAIMAQVDSDGHVHSGCAEGYPAAEVRDYLNMPPVVDDPHALAGVILAAATQNPPRTWSVM